jgi:hypothetical protein
MKFETPTPVMMIVLVLLVEMWCGIVGGYQHFDLKMGAVMLASTYNPLNLKNFILYISSVLTFQCRRHLKMVE